jgi:hypothetical protein
MRCLLVWLEHDGLGLDSAGQEAVMMILDGAYGNAIVPELAAKFVKAFIEAEGLTPA